LTEDILALICERGEVAAREIRDTLGISEKTLRSEIVFLVKFGFVRFDKTNQFVRLTNRSKKYAHLKIIDG
jgi:predicted ArsR family transcriptional regulator